MNAATWARTGAAGLALALVLAVVPGQVDVGWLTTLTSCAIYAIPAAGAAVLYGRLGIASLTQIAMVGVGGWVTLRIGLAHHLPFLVLVVAAGVIAALVGALLAVPALRLRDLHLALVTLLVAAGVEVALGAASFPNGGGGITGYDPSGAFTRLARPGFATSDVAYFRLSVVIAALVFVGLVVAQRSSLGRAWGLIGQSEGAAYACGIRVSRAKVVGFGLACGSSGVAGALLAGQVGQLAPANFSALQSLTLFAVVVLAGTRGPVGWIGAALLFRALPYWFQQQGYDANLTTVLFGAAVAVVVVAAPQGITGVLSRSWRRASLAEQTP